MPFTFHPTPSTLPSPLLRWLWLGSQQLALWLWSWRPPAGTSGNSPEQPSIVRVTDLKKTGGMQS